MNDASQGGASWWKWALFGIGGILAFRFAAAAADRGLARSLAAKRNGARRKRKRGLAGACWPGFEAYGFKMKGSRRVPRCVPVREAR